MLLIIIVSTFQWPRFFQSFHSGGRNVGLLVMTKAHATQGKLVFKFVRNSYAV